MPEWDKSVVRPACFELPVGGSSYEELSTPIIYGRPKSRFHSDGTFRKTKRWLVVFYKNVSTLFWLIKFQKIEEFFSFEKKH